MYHNNSHALISFVLTIRSNTTSVDYNILIHPSTSYIYVHITALSTFLFLLVTPHTITVVLTVTVSTQYTYGS